MISVALAQEKIKQAVSVGPVQKVNLHAALGHVLAADVHSPIDLPRFDNAAMDGFAVRIEDTDKATQANPTRLKIVETIAAGAVPNAALQAGEAMRIMTGAMLPDGATGVVQQEHVAVSGEQLQIFAPIKAGTHIRRCAEEISQGSTALTQGEKLTAGGVGFLAAMGIKTAPIFSQPKVTLISTGSELVDDVSELGAGKIVESNAKTLKAAFGVMGIEPVVVAPLADVKNNLAQALEVALSISDIVIVTGGVSVGEYDLVKPLLAEKGVEKIFWQVAQKPGKPLFFGARDQTLVFGLPGNPAASLVCFYQYVRPAVLRWMGHKICHLRTETAKLAETIKTRGERTHFVRASTTPDTDGLVVAPLEKQGSHCMQSFARANSLLVLPAQKNAFMAGEPVTIQWLPAYERAGL